MADADVVDVRSHGSSSDVDSDIPENAPTDGDEPERAVSPPLLMHYEKLAIADFEEGRITGTHCIENGMCNLCGVYARRDHLESVAHFNNQIRYNRTLRCLLLQNDKVPTIARIGDVRRKAAIVDLLADTILHAPSDSWWKVAAHYMVGRRRVADLFEDRCANTAVVTADTACVCCWTRPRSKMFMPCRHLVCCSACSLQVSRCPVCRSEIQSREEVYLS